MISGIWKGPIPCKVESSTRVYPGGDNDGVDRGKWVYTIKAIDWGDEYAFPTGSRTDAGFESSTALNIYELGNDATTQYGITVSTLPGTYELKPVPDGAYVMAYVSPAAKDDQDFRLCIFQYPNQFDGACT